MCWVSSSNWKIFIIYWTCIRELSTHTHIYICHSCMSKWVHSNHQSQTSVGTSKALGSLLPGTLDWEHSICGHPNKPHKNQSLISEWCMIVKEQWTKTCIPSWFSTPDKPNVGMHWSTLWFCIKPRALSKISNLEPPPHVQMPFYIPLTITSCPDTHITMQSSGDVMLWRLETHTHAPKCVSGNPPLRACLLVQPHSNHVPPSVNLPACFFTPLNRFWACS